VKTLFTRKARRFAPAGPQPLAEWFCDARAAGDAPHSAIKLGGVFSGHG